MLALKASAAAAAASSSLASVASRRAAWFVRWLYAMPAAVLSWALAAEPAHAAALGAAGLQSGMSPSQAFGQLCSARLTNADTCASTTSQQGSFSLDVGALRDGRTAKNIEMKLGFDRAGRLDSTTFMAVDTDEVQLRAWLGQLSGIFGPSPRRQGTGGPQESYWAWCLPERQSVTLNRVQTTTWIHVQAPDDYCKGRPLAQAAQALELYRASSTSAAGAGDTLARSQKPFRLGGSMQDHVLLLQCAAEEIIGWVKAFDAFRSRHIAADGKFTGSQSDATLGTYVRAQIDGGVRMYRPFIDKSADSLRIAPNDRKTLEQTSLQKVNEYFPAESKGDGWRRCPAAVRKMVRCDKPSQNGTETECY